MDYSKFFISLGLFKLHVCILLTISLIIPIDIDFGSVRRSAGIRNRKQKLSIGMRSIYTRPSTYRDQRREYEPVIN